MYPSHTQDTGRPERGGSAPVHADTPEQAAVRKFLFAAEMDNMTIEEARKLWKELNVKSS